ncbi:hypothetical protein Plim_2999 [Planctopirus limnophila DSM 3776]|uniref:Uncharacterized protein n=1 Tax=Planctopirus limnophila (strain ATCC 43296 / DSM 3776 / IFAM 1008 / Mu 290) TaxID=521674 RepID=D5SS97_PLAL2|nr:hypothetical protein [Planctopirus limnophila]ADG68821.1 hypothetical protein Plim_2999 [Planctopirus limnophila DSM 3776]
MPETLSNPLPLPSEQPGEPKPLRDHQRPAADSILDVAGIAGHCPACGQKALLVSAVCTSCEEPLVVAKGSDGQSILRLQRDAHREKILRLEDQLSIYWIMLGSFQFIVMLSISPVIIRNFRITVTPLIQQSWMSLHTASMMLSLIVTGLILFVCGMAMKFGFRQIAWLGVLANFWAFVVTLASPMFIGALVYAILLLPACRLMWLWYKSPGMTVFNGQCAPTAADRLS